MSFCAYNFRNTTLANNTEPRRWPVKEKISFCAAPLFASRLYSSVRFPFKMFILCVSTVLGLILVPFGVFRKRRLPSKRESLTDKADMPAITRYMPGWDLSGADRKSTASDRPPVQWPEMRVHQGADPSRRGKYLRSSDWLQTRPFANRASDWLAFWLHNETDK